MERIESVQYSAGLAIGAWKGTSRNKIYEELGCVAILTHLRVGLSKLNSQKFSHNFPDTVNPMCLVNDGIEDTEHFLLHCHAYDGQKCDLLGAINEILQLNFKPVK